MNDTDNNQTMTVENPLPVPVKGVRGEIGVASTSTTIKRAWAMSKGKLSLKRFAHQLAKEGDQVATDWLAHKRGSLNANRNDKNMARSVAEASASKQARRKGKGK